MEENIEARWGMIKIKAVNGGVLLVQFDPSSMQTNRIGIPAEAFEAVIKNLKVVERLQEQKSDYQTKKGNKQ